MDEKGDNSKSRQIMSALERVAKSHFVANCYPLTLLLDGTINLELYGQTVISQAILEELEGSVQGLATLDRITKSNQEVGYPAFRILNSEVVPITTLNFAVHP